MTQPVYALPMVADELPGVRARLRRDKRGNAV